MGFLASSGWAIAMLFAGFILGWGTCKFVQWKFGNKR